MQIRFNDETITCAAAVTVAMFLHQLRQLTTGVALALNEEILPRERWEEQLLQEGDRILLFQVIAGG